MLRLQLLKSDLAKILVIGWPLVINNCASIGVNVADTLMASRLGSTELAGFAIGSGVWIAVFLLGLGTVMALGPTVAQHYGAGKHEAIGHDTRQGFWLALVISVLVIAIMRSMSLLLLAVGIAAEVVALAQGYLDSLSWGVFAAYAYHTLKQASEGVGRTLPIAVVMGIALPINIVLTYSLMFGRFGAPALGVAGCGLGAAVSFWLMFAMLALYTRHSGHYARFRIWRALEIPDFQALRRLLALGLPIGLSLFLQSGLFTTVALLMGVLGTYTVAAHQVALNYSGLVFMVPLGLGMALTVCVGQAVGRADAEGAARIGFTGIGLCAAVTLITGSTTFIFAESIARVYSTDPSVMALAAVLFKIAALLQIGDGCQVAAAFALRGLKDTRVPLILNAIIYWGIGFTLAYGIGIYLNHGATGIWLGLTVALCVASVALIARFIIVTRHMRALAVTVEVPLEERQLIR